MAKKNGFILVVLIILIVVSSIILYSTIIFISQSLRLGTIKTEQHQARMAAQAGLMAAAYNALLTPAVFSPKNAQIANTNQYYTYQFSSSLGEFNQPYIDASDTKAGTTGIPLRYVYHNWKIINPSVTQTCTISAIQVNWTNAQPSEKFTQLRLQVNPPIAWNSSNGVAANTKIDLTYPFALSPGLTTSGNQLRFDTNLGSRTITATFFLTNNTSFESIIWPPVPKVIIDASASKAGTAGNPLRYVYFNWKIINSSPTQFYTIEAVRVNWTDPNPSIRFTQLRLQVNPPIAWDSTNGVAANTTVETYPFILSPGSTSSGNQLRFTATMEARTIEATFFLSNNSTFQGRIWLPKALPATSTPDTIKATGKIVKNNQVVMRQTYYATFEITGTTKKMTIRQFKDVPDHIMP